MVCPSTEPSRRSGGGVAVGIMCKAPIEGASKTRLSPPLSLAQAAALSGCLIADTVALTLAAVRDLPSVVFVVYTPTDAEALVDGLVPASVRRVAQRGDTLGERLRHATEDLLAEGFDAVCLMNADSPTLPASLVRRAVETLRLAPRTLVLVPSIDGGYCLIGLSAADDWPFRDIDWSTGAVLAQTLARAAAAGVPALCLPMWYDVDDPTSLDLLIHELFQGDIGLGDGFTGGEAVRCRDFLADWLRGRGDDRCAALRQSI